MRWGRVGVAIVSCGAFAEAVTAATLRVPADHPTIQAAIDAATNDDVILVAPGVYDENLDTHGKRLTLRGESGAASTIVDGGRRARVVLLSGGGGVEAMTLRNGRSNVGGGVRVQGAGPTVVRDCIIKDNFVAYGIDAGEGGGVYLGGDSRNVLVERNLIRANHAYAGAGIYDSYSSGASNRIVDNTVIDNDASFGGGYYGGSAEFRGNLVVSNRAGTGGGVHGGAVRFENNTIVRNGRAGGGTSGAGIAIAGIQAHYRNNIVALNVGTGIVCFSDLGTPTFECNDVWGNDGGNWETFDPPYACDTTANFSVDPIFCGVEDYRLSSSSPFAPAGASGCGLVGAFSVACGTTSVTHRSWGGVKAVYR